MTESEYKTIDKAFQEAEQSDTPFLIAAEDELVVAGDANKTELNIHDFEVTFRIPVEENGKVKYTTKTKEYKGVYITPRRDSDIVKALTVLLPFFRGLKADENGEIMVSDLTEEEKKQIFDHLTDEVYDAMYDVVASVLRIDPDLKEFMHPTSVMINTAKVIRCYAEVVNEADTFFG